MSKKQIKGKNWCFTINNPTQLDEDSLRDLVQSVSYVVYGKEKGKEGTPHLQGFCVFTKVVSPKAVSKLLPRAHIEPARGSWQQNRTYCTKDGDFTELGSPPVDRGAKEKERWAEAKQMCIEQKVEDLPADIYFRFYRTAKEIARDHMVKPEHLDEVCGVWYHGPSGTGKTTQARLNFPDAYIKDRTKWWDGYQGEDAVILDDLSPFHVGLADYLKDWSDKWSFKAETKGGYKWIRPKVFVVTSQYSIMEIWNDHETRQALLRRFNCVYFNGKTRI